MSHPIPPPIPIWVFFHKHSWFTEQQGKGEAIFLTPLYHFHPLHRHLDISRVVTAESSPLHIAISQARTRNLWFPSPFSIVTSWYNKMTLKAIITWLPKVPQYNIQIGKSWRRKNENKYMKIVFSIVIYAINHSSTNSILLFNPFSTNVTKWSNILKQFLGNLLTNCLSVFDHFMGLALKGLTCLIHK